MKKLAVVLLIALTIVTMSACGASENSGNSINTVESDAYQSEVDGSTSLKDQIIGTWEIVNSNYSVSKMVLYKGGTGKGYESTMTDGSTYYSLAWDIKDEVVNISLDPTGHFVTGYTLEEGELVSVDGERHYKKIE